MAPWNVESARGPVPYYLVDIPFWPGTDILSRLNLQFHVCDWMNNVCLFTSIAWRARDVDRRDTADDVPALTDFPVCEVLPRLSGPKRR